MICLFPRQTISITVIQIYASTIDVEEAEFDIQDLLELTPKRKDVLFIIGGQNANVGSQKRPRITGKFFLEVQNEKVKG